MGLLDIYFIIRFHKMIKVFYDLWVNQLVLMYYFYKFQQMKKVQLK